MHPEMALILLFSAATAVAIAARRVKIPYTVALVLTGLGLGATPLIQGVHLTKDLLYSVFLPGLLFEAAYHLEDRRRRCDSRPTGLTSRRIAPERRRQWTTTSG